MYIHAKAFETFSLIGAKPRVIITTANISNADRSATLKEIEAVCASLRMLNRGSFDEYVQRPIPRVDIRLLPVDWPTTSPLKLRKSELHLRAISASFRQVASNPLILQSPAAEQMKLTFTMRYSPLRS